VTLRDSSQASRRRLLAAFTAAAALLFVAAAVAAVWFGVGWVRAGLVTDAPRAAARDAALDGARQAGLNLASMNPDDIDGTVKLMESSATGDLLDSMVSHADAIKQAAKKADTRVQAKVLEAAVTDLDSERSHASTIVVLQQTQTPRSGQPVYVQKVTWDIHLVKTGDVWKADYAKALGPAVVMDGPAVNPTPPPASTPDPGAAPPAQSEANPQSTGKPGS
jgi:Mce-associated membrane protein